VKLVNGAQLFAPNLPSLADVPGLHYRAGGNGGGIARPRLPHHVINFFLIENFLHEAFILTATVRKVFENGVFRVAESRLLKCSGGFRSRGRRFSHIQEIEPGPQAHHGQ